MDRLLAHALVGVVGMTSLTAASISFSTAANGAVLAAKHAKAPASKGTCSQLTDSEVQPVMVDTITKVKVKAVTALTFTAGQQKQKIGQQCTYEVTGSSTAMTIIVISGSFAAKAYNDDVKSLEKPVAVPGVGAKAVRAPVDSNGAAATTTVSALKGTTYCSVSPGDGEVPGIATLEEAAGYTNDIGDKAQGEMAAALGTLCNRVFGSGNTTPTLTALISAGQAAKAAAATPTNPTTTVSGSTTTPTKLLGSTTPTFSK